MSAVAHVCAYVHDCGRSQCIIIASWRPRFCVVAAICLRFTHDRGTSDGRGVIVLVDGGAAAGLVTVLLCLIDCLVMVVVVVATDRFGTASSTCTTHAGVASILTNLWTSWRCSIRNKTSETRYVLVSSCVRFAVFAVFAVCGVRRAVCGVWCAVCGVRCAMCAVRCGCAVLVSIDTAGTSRE